jgi:hypothetical protein
MLDIRRSLVGAGVAGAVFGLALAAAAQPAQPVAAPGSAQPAQPTQAVPPAAPALSPVPWLTVGALAVPSPFQTPGAGVERRPVPDTHSFQVILLEASNAGAPSVEGLPPNAQKALRDLQDFLPYKHYRLLDMGWMHTAHEASTRLQGVGDRTYAANIVVSRDRGEDGKLFIERFLLRDDTIPPTPPPPPPPPGAQRGAAGARTAPVPRAMLAARGTSLISTAFGIEVGETVVVGTSRLNGGDKALMALLTVVPRKR